MHPFLEECIFCMFAVPSTITHDRQFIFFGKKSICIWDVHFFSNFGRRLLEGNSYLAMLERIFQHFPEITVARCSPYYSSQSVCAGYALAQSGNVVPSRTPTSLRSPTSKLLPPYAAHTQAFFNLKINFRSKHLCMCIFFCTFARFLQSKRNNVKNTLHNRRM